MPCPEPAHVLIVAPGAPGSHATGPEIRALGIAEGLAPHFAVTVATSANVRPPVASVDVVPYERRQVLALGRRSSAIIGPWLPPFLMAAVAPWPSQLVSDLYDPVEFELPGQVKGEDEAELARVSRLTRLQTRFADLLLCGSARQEQRLEEVLCSDRRHDVSVITVPFGLPAPPPPSTARPLRARFPVISDDDVVLLWWGSPWRWLDLESVVRAVAALGEQSRIKLVVTAGQPATPEARSRLNVDEARAIARDLGVLDRCVLFMDEWIPFADRHEYLLEADLGITMHGGQEEARLAVRARYLDYLWCRLPCILSGGDELSRQFADIGFAKLVPAGDVRAAAAAIVGVADDSAWREQAARAGDRLASTLRWESVVKPLVRALRKGAGDRRPAVEVLRLNTRVAAYYGYLAGERWLRYTPRPRASAMGRR